MSTPSERVFQFTVQASGSPAWSQTTINQWTSLASTQLTAVMTDTEPFSTNKNFITSYSGAALDETALHLYVIGGGHADSANNGCYRLKLGQATPAWERVRGPTPQAQIQGAATAEQNAYKYYLDGRPTSRHTYYNLQVQPTLTRIFMYGGGAIWGNGGALTPHTDTFNITTSDYDSAGSWPDNPIAYNGPTLCVKDSAGDVWLAHPGTGQVYKWSLATQTYALAGTANVYNTDTPACYDSLRDRIVRFPKGVQGQYWNRAGAFSVTSFSFSGGLTSASGHAVYEPTLDRYLYLSHGSNVLWSIHPTTWAATQVSTTGTPWTPAGDGTSNYYGRFCYVPSLGGVIVVPNGNSNVYWMRTH